MFLLKNDWKNQYFYKIKHREFSQGYSDSPNSVWHGNDEVLHGLQANLSPCLIQRIYQTWNYWQPVLRIFQHFSMDVPQIFDRIEFRNVRRLHVLRSEVRKLMFLYSRIVWGACCLLPSCQNSDSRHLGSHRNNDSRPTGLCLPKISDKFSFNRIFLQFLFKMFISEMKCLGLRGKRSFFLQSPLHAV